MRNGSLMSRKGNGDSVDSIYSLLYLSVMSEIDILFGKGSENLHSIC